MTVDVSKFDAIRPYNDAEVRPVIERLLADDEFINSMIHLKLPAWLRPLTGLVRKVVRWLLVRELANVNSVAALQDKIEGYLVRVINRTTTGWSISGVENVSPATAHLFVSNHRDISMDPAIVNLSLHNNAFTTLRIAIGDNLLTKPFASDLMRLNKSFIVNRSAKGPREKLKAAKLLSQYIHHSVQQDNENIWIAQREGRAKDGIDVTNSAIIGMFGLSKAKTDDFGEHIASLNIVPVAISYEFDPCDCDKAHELHQKQTQGEYVKDEHEDVRSIAKGITGFKGRVHLAFGEQLGAQFNDTDSVVAEIDRQIQTLYVLFPTNGIAYELLYDKKPDVMVTEDQVAFCSQSWPKERAELVARMANLNDDERTLFLLAYANPVSAQLGELAS